VIIVNSIPRRLW